MESVGSLEEICMFSLYERTYKFNKLHVYKVTFNKLHSEHSDNWVDWLHKDRRLVQLHQKFGGWDDGYRSTKNQIASKPFVWS